MRGLSEVAYGKDRVIWLFTYIHIVGYCGADMKALCTEAALHALRRRYPQIYTSSDKLQLDINSIHINAADFHYAMTKIVPAGMSHISTYSLLTFMVFTSFYRSIKVND